MKKRMIRLKNLVKVSIQLSFYIEESPKPEDKYKDNIEINANNIKIEESGAKEQNVRRVVIKDVRINPYIQFRVKLLRKQKIKTKIKVILIFNKINNR